MAETKLSVLRQNLQDGCIGSFYTLKKWFLKVRPCFAIDKVKFSFVMKGSDGKTAFDVYMNTEDFDNFCDEILSGVMRKKVAEDKGDFPSAFVYKTGKNASKQLSFGSGKDQPFVFQGRTPEQNAFVAVGEWQDIVTMAKLWRKFSKPYYEELTEIFVEGAKKIDAYFTSDDEKTVEEECEPANETPKEAETPKETPREVSNPTQVEKKDERLAIVTGNAQIYTLIPAGTMAKAENYTDAKPSFTMRCQCKELGKDVEVIFLSAPIGKSTDNFNLLKDRVDSGWRGSFKIEGQLSEYKGREQLRFTTFYVRKGA